MSTPIGGNNYPESSEVLNNYVVDFADLPNSQVFCDYMRNQADQSALYVSQNTPLRIPHIIMTDSMKEIAGYSNEVTIEDLYLEAFDNSTGSLISGTFSCNGLPVAFYVDDKASTICITSNEGQVAKYDKDYYFILDLLENMLKAAPVESDDLYNSGSIHTADDYLKAIKDVSINLAYLFGAYSKSYKHMIEDYDKDRVVEIELIEAESIDGNHVYVAVDMAWQLTDNNTHEVCLLVSDKYRGGDVDHDYTGYRQPIIIPPSDYGDREFYGTIASGEVQPYYLNPKEDYDGWQSAVVSVMQVINHELEKYTANLAINAESLEQLIDVEDESEEQED